MKIKTFMDGSSWVAIDTDNFINLAESDAGFGETEEEAIQELLEIHEDRKIAKISALTALTARVDHFNEYSGRKMEYLERSPDYYGLFIDDLIITEGDYDDIMARVILITKEEGLLFL